MTDASSLELNLQAQEAVPSVDNGDGALEIATEKLQGRQRRILAAISIPCSVEQVWQVLTDYEHLADFVPNLTVSRRLETSGSETLLEQVGAQCFLNVKFCARVVLNMVEQFPHQIGFTMVEGDFKSFEGSWKLRPDDSSFNATRLTYEVNICPPKAIPAVLIERHLRHDLTQNLHAIRHHTMAIADTL